MKRKRGIALTGMMGAGKSIVGRLLARELSRPFLDMDEEIERREGATIADIFRERGEVSFRALESTLLRETCGSFDGVLATGGGVVLSSANRALLSRWGTVVYLKADATVLAGRLGGDGRSVRPLLAKGVSLDGILKEMLSRRDVFYSEAEWIIDTSALSPREVCGRIVESLSP